METFNIEIYEDFILLVNPPTIPQINTNVYTTQNYFLCDIFRNHRWKQISNENRYYYFKPELNVYGEKYTDEDFKILLERLKKYMIDNNCIYNFLEKKLLP